MNLAEEAFRNFARSWKRHSATQFSTLVVLTGTFVAMATFLCLITQAEGILTRWGNHFAVSIYLEDDISSEAQSKVAKFLSDTEGVKDIKFISKTDAMEKFRSQVSDYAKDLVDSGGFGNPLPASYELRLDRELSQMESLPKVKSMVESLRKFTGIQEVSYGQIWMDQYAAVFNEFSKLSWFLVMVLVAGSFLVIGNSIRSSMAQRQEEIAVLEMIGATPAMIQVPFVIEGSLMGILASGLSALIVSFFWKLGVSHILANPELAGLAELFRTFDRRVILVTLLLGPLSGAVGAYFCVNRLRQFGVQRVGFGK